MALLPPPGRGDGLPKTRRHPVDVPGTVNISYGHRLAECDSRRVTRHRGSIFEERPAERPEVEARTREVEQLLKIFEFEKDTDRKIRRRNVRRRVEQDLSVYEENLQERREKLRDLVLNEEADLTTELAEKARLDEDARFEEIRAKTEELTKRREEERRATVAAKRMQQCLAANPDVKEKNSRKFAVDAKRCNLAQMTENEARRSAEKKLDELWDEMMLRDLEARERRESEESEKRVSAARETASTLARQVEDRLELEEDRKRNRQREREELERLAVEARNAELRELELQRQKRERLKREIEEELLTVRQHLAERRAREDDATADAALFQAPTDSGEPAGEKARARKSTATSRAELLAYMRYREELQREEVRRDLELDAAFQQSRKDAEARREVASRKLKEARRRELQEVLRVREEQVRAKREAEEEERRLRIAEKEALERQIEMDADLTSMERSEIRQRAYRYRQDLKEQCEQVETRRRRELEENRSFYQAEMKRQEDEYRAVVSASENATRHPFEVLSSRAFEELVGSRQTTREDGCCCCCPPMLTSA